MPKMIRKRKTAEDQAIKIVFDVDMVEALIKYMRCEYITQPQRMAVHRLMNILDFTQYQYNQDILDRLSLLKILAQGMCEDHIYDDSVMMSYIRERLEGAEDIINSVNFKKNQINDSECNLMNKFINERLQYIYIY